MIRKTLAPMGAALVCIGVMLGGCASQPTLNTSADAKMSYDGLYPIEGSRTDQAWARSDLDLSGYTKIMLQGAGIHYRPLKASAGSRTALRRGETEFPLSDDQKERLRKMLREEFLKELAKIERFTFVNQSGPDVLMIRGALLDVVSRVPPEQIGRVDIYLDSVGQATLVIELIDSESGTVLARAVDTRAADRGGVAIESNRVTNWADARRLVQRWAVLLRQRLNDVSGTLGIGMEG